jgi:hypothetical protein
MKRLSISLISLAFLLALAGMGFTAKPTGATPKPDKARDILYYWYNTSDTYVDYATVANEEYSLELQYGVLVDENSIGGTLLEKGYVNPGKPHMSFAGSILYGHF